MGKIGARLEFVLIVVSIDLREDRKTSLIEKPAMTLQVFFRQSLSR